MKKFMAIALATSLMATPTLFASEYTGNSKVVTTGQTTSTDKDGNIIETTDSYDAYYGQDADYDSLEFSFTNNGDGTITDNNTGLMWQEIPIDSKMTWSQAMEYCESLELAGYDDWRLPTADELFSISDFSVGWPYIDVSFFIMPDSSTSSGPQNSGPQNGGPQNGGPQGGAPQGIAPIDSEDGETPPPLDGEARPPVDGEALPPADGEALPPVDGEARPPADGEARPPVDGEALPPVDGDTPPPPEGTGESSISKDEGQFWSSNYYLVEAEGARSGVAFGVNHATGHIKAYIAESAPAMGKNVRAVRGDEYAANDLVDNGDGTITDLSTGLMWMADDIGEAVDWEDALKIAEAYEFAGYDDWRLPDVKELQTVVDYSGYYPAIDPAYFTTTELEENEFYYYWTSTSAYFSPQDPTEYFAWYVAFGYAVDNAGNDSHGAGGVRFSQKHLESEAEGEGGDNILNSVRLVRTVD
ncbi:MAG: hypothetical protein BEN18_07620 [Epulopiscium sp. Nuni2H_MBin001]|nr:MAG: hypothetical protein BEN18_07620 [Epulopiscium sp. Nuni2H_MBin001]